MGKKSKQKKNKYKDFQKVKLKVGKKLPKGQNETIATFKTRTIQVKKQLGKQDIDTALPTTKRKLNINVTTFNIAIKLSCVNSNIFL